MALCEVHLGESSALRRGVTFIAIVPDAKPGPFPVLYLLHGLTDDYTGWMRRSSIERYVEKLPLIVVMPDGGRSFYTDSPVTPSLRYETFICKDLVGFVDRTFPTIARPKSRAIAGLSMGGYGALKLGLKHPDLFCAVASHSGAVDVAGSVSRGVFPGVEWQQVFGEDPLGGPDDLFAIAERADRSTLPALHIDCGVDDDLLPANQRFHAHLTELCIPHEYAEYAGGHTWSYWDSHIQETIKWICAQFDLS